MALIDDIKISLRITSSSFDTEISDLISSAKLDLEISGVTSTKANDSTDALIKRAITTYVKANFGYNNPDYDRLHLSYDKIKSLLTLAREYETYTITITVQDSVTTSKIHHAEVIFNSVTKLTNSSGVVVFYERPDNGYEYSVSADGYSSVSEQLLDVSGATTLTVNLVEV